MKELQNNNSQIKSTLFIELGKKEEIENNINDVYGETKTTREDENMLIDSIWVHILLAESFHKSHLKRNKVVCMIMMIIA
jgi:hypothetical protein